MTSSDTRATKPAPVWALLIGIVVVIGGVVLLAQLLDAQIQAFAFAEEGSANRLLWPAVFGEVALTLVVWFALRIAFARAWKKRGDRLYVWLGVLLAAAVMTSTVTLIYSVQSARVEAIRAAAALDRLEQAAIDRTVARFPDEQDAELITDVFREMRRWADPISDIREVTVSRDPNGAWEAVCGQVSIKGGKWAGFVTRSVDGGYLRAALEQDGFDEAKRKTCRPLAQKYLGIDGVDIKAYMAERDALGCTQIDIYYWQSEKAYCHGKVVQPRP